MRDLDAHSWVEVWFTGHRLGAVRPDARALAGAVAVERSRHERRGGRRRRGEAGAQGVAAGARRSDTGGALGSRRRERLARAGAPAALAVPLAGRALVLGCRVRRLRHLGAGRGRRGAAVRAAPRARAARLGPAGVDHAAGPRAPVGRFAGPPRRPMRGRCAPTATTRAPRARPACASAGSSAGSSAAAASYDRLRGLVAIPPGAPRLGRHAGPTADLSNRKVGALYLSAMTTKRPLSNILAGVLGGLIVLVIGAVLIATDVIDTGDTRRSCASRRSRSRRRRRTATAAARSTRSTSRRAAGWSSSRRGA